VTVEIFASNLASTSVSNGGTTAPAAGTSQNWVVASSTGFPAASSSASPITQFHVADPVAPSEMIAVTNVSGTTWTVTRGAESTVPVPHTQGFTIYQVVTTGGLSNFLQTGTNPNGLDWVNVVTAYGADPTGSSDSSTAFQNAVNKVVTAGGGVVYVPAGIYKASTTTTKNIAGTAVYIVGDGKWSTIIKWYGTGDVFRIYDSTSYLTKTVNGGGILGVTFDGSNATGNSAGFHIGDIEQLQFDVAVQNFTAGTTSKGAWFDNNYNWTEQMTGQIYASSCSAGVVFDNTANTSGSATGSFDRMNLNIFINSNGAGDGVVFQNGALTQNMAQLGIWGNFLTSTTQYAVLRITGNNNALAGPDPGYSFISDGTLNIGVELDDNNHLAPYTIYFGSSSNELFACNGLLSFAGNFSFTQSNKGSNFGYYGQIISEPTLASATNYFPTAVSTPAGLNLGGYNSPVSVTANGQTITAGGFAYVPVTCASSFSGLILGSGFYDGQIAVITNQGTGSLIWAAAGTSNVSGGTSDAIAASTTAMYVHDGESSLWYRVLPSSPVTAASSAYGLNSATTIVSVSGATAPSTGQALTATSSSTATWQAPFTGIWSGSSGSKSSITTTTKTDIGPTYAVPANTAGSGVTYHLEAFVNLTADTSLNAASVALYWGGITGTSLVSIANLSTTAGPVSTTPSIINIVGDVFFTSATSCSAYIGAAAQDSNYDNAFATTTGLSNAAGTVLTFAWTWAGTTGTIGLVPEFAYATRLV
jgi:hypothetical protein